MTSFYYQVLGRHLGGKDMCQRERERGGEEEDKEGDDGWAGGEGTEERQTNRSLDSPSHF